MGCTRMGSGVAYATCSLMPARANRLGATLVRDGVAEAVCAGGLEPVVVEVTPARLMVSVKPAEVDVAPVTAGSSVGSTSPTSLSEDTTIAVADGRAVADVDGGGAEGADSVLVRWRLEGGELPDDVGVALPVVAGVDGDLRLPPRAVRLPYDCIGERLGEVARKGGGGGEREMEWRARARSGEGGERRRGERGK